eukprot:3613883-Pleurochrysis_carterae.AAC.1
MPSVAGESQRRLRTGRGRERGREVAAGQEFERAEDGISGIRHKRRDRARERGGRREREKGGGGRAKERARGSRPPESGGVPAPPRQGRARARAARPRALAQRAARSRAARARRTPARAAPHGAPAHRAEQHLKTRQKRLRRRRSRTAVAPRCDGSTSFKTDTPPPPHDAAVPNQPAPSSSRNAHSPRQRRPTASPPQKMAPRASECGSSCGDSMSSAPTRCGGGSDAITCNGQAPLSACAPVLRAGSPVRALDGERASGRRPRGERLSTRACVSPRARACKRIHACVRACASVRE